MSIFDEGQHDLVVDESSSAARIAELESEVNRWRSQVEITSEQQCPICCKSSPDDNKRIRELEGDCKAMAAAVLSKDWIPEGYRKCSCPACIIAAKYREG